MSTATLDKLESPAVFKLGVLEHSDQNHEANQPLRCGYGKCGKCNCQHFEGNEDTCANSGCGHAFYDHF